MDLYESVKQIKNQKAEHLDWFDWPDVEYPDIYSYFIATPGVTTQAYKSMDGYKFFLDG